MRIIPPNHTPSKQLFFIKHQTAQVFKTQAVLWWIKLLDEVHHAFFRVAVESDYLEVHFLPHARVFGDQCQWHPMAMRFQK